MYRVAVGVQCVLCRFVMALIFLDLGEIVVEGEWRCVDGFGEGGSVRFR